MQISSFANDFWIFSCVNNRNNHVHSAAMSVQTLSPINLIHCQNRVT